MGKQKRSPSQEEIDTIKATMIANLGNMRPPGCKVSDLEMDPEEAERLSAAFRQSATRIYRRRLIRRISCIAVLLTLVLVIPALILYFSVN